MDMVIAQPKLPSAGQKRVKGQGVRSGKKIRHIMQISSDSGTLVWKVDTVIQTKCTYFFTWEERKGGIQGKRSVTVKNG